MDPKFEEDERVETLVDTELYPSGSGARVIEVDAAARRYKVEFEEPEGHFSGDVEEFDESDLRSPWGE